MSDTPTEQTSTNPTEQKNDAKSGKQNSKKSRRLGRLLAVRLLYAYEFKRYEDDGQLIAVDEEDAADHSAEVYAQELFQLYQNQRPAIDSNVDKRLKNWTLHRLATTDRAILRLGATELLYRDDVPPKVIINECVELAKQVGSDARSHKLINGVLDTIARDHRGGEVRKKPQQARQKSLVVPIMTNHWSRMDQQWMLRACPFTACSQGYTALNPNVGCVIVYEGQEIGSGRHEQVAVRMVKFRL